MIPIKSNGKIDYSSIACFESLKRYEISGKELGKYQNTENGQALLGSTQFGAIKIEIFWDN